MSSYCLTIIPARIGSTRLPAKPLLEVDGCPLVVRVARRAMSAKLGRVVIATDHIDIKSIVEARGFEAVMTQSEHQSGSDRIYEALIKIDPDGKFDTVINMQVDLPTINAEDIIHAVHLLADESVDIATICSGITPNGERNDPNVVKAGGILLTKQRLHALHFSRVITVQSIGPLYHHIGLYVYRRKALKRFVSLSPSVLEKRERLEQLRALENGMRIDAAIVKSVPLSIDTAEDLERARIILTRSINL